MAKLAFSKLNKIKTLPSHTVELEGNTIEIKPYLPLADKLQLLTNVLELSGADEGYFNLVQLEVFYKIEVIKKYTNITFTDKQMEDPAKLYDQIELNGVWEIVENHIPEMELDYVWGAILDMAREITTYNRSFAGMLHSLSTDYSNLNMDATSLKEIITSPEVKNLLNRFLPETEIGLNS